MKGKVLCGVCVDEMGAVDVRAAEAQGVAWRRIWVLDGEQAKGVIQPALTKGVLGLARESRTDPIKCLRREQSPVTFFCTQLIHEVWQLERLEARPAGTRAASWDCEFAGIERGL